MTALVDEPMLIGRERELALLDELLVRGRERGAALVLHGEPGVGKSTLAGAAVARARAAGTTVATTTGVPSEAELPYACLHQLLTPMLDRVARLPPPQRDALERALGAGGDGDGPPVDAYRTGLAVLDLLGDAAEDTPVLVVAEDAHWLDDPTCAVLAFVARRIEADPIALLVTSRPDVPRALRGAGLAEERLDPLSADASEALLQALDGALSPAARRQVLEQAAGNPLGLVELVSEAARGADAPAMPSWMPLTTRLERTFAARRAELPALTRTVLLVAALTDHGDAGEVLAAAAQVAGADVTLDAFVPAIAAGLVTVDERRVRFAHPLMRAAIAQGGSAAARRAAHAALAEAAAHDPARAVWHRVGAAGSTDDALAQELTTVAHAAVRRGSLVTAAQTLGRAATLTSDEAVRAARLLDAGELAVEVGRVDVVKRMLADARPLTLDAADEPRRAWLERTVAHPAPTAPWLTANLDRAEQLLAERDVVRAAQALLTVAFRCWWVDVPDAVRGRVVALADALPGAAEVADTIARSLVAPARDGVLVAERLERLDPDATPADLLRFVAVCGPVVGSFERGVVIAERAVERLRARGRYGLLAPALTARAWSGVYVGGWSAALAAAADGAVVSHETDQPLWAVSTTAAQATLTALRGAPDDALALADRAAELLVPGEADGMRALIELARAIAEVEADRLEEATLRFARLRDPGQPWHTDFVARWTVADAANAASRAGDAEALAALVAWAQAAPGPSAHLRGALAYARLLAASDAEVEVAAQDALTACAGLPALRARTQLAYGSRLRLQHHTGDARATLRAARETFEALGMTLPAERVREELRAAGETVQLGPIDAAELLSPHELQIARMAADGLSNREIGAALYLSHRTVGSHLYRIFPKLGIASRAQLAAVLG